MTHLPPELYESDDDPPLHREKPLRPYEEPTPEYLAALASAQVVLPLLSNGATLVMVSSPPVQKKKHVTHLGIRTEPEVEPEPFFLTNQERLDLAEQLDNDHARFIPVCIDHAAGEFKSRQND